MAPSIDQQFIEFIVKSLVGHPDDVVVDRLIDEKGVLLTLTVHPEDLGRVIGKRGATAQSLRSLLRALGTKNDARYNLKIVDVDKPEGERGEAPRRAETADTDDAAARTSSWRDDRTPMTEGEDLTLRGGDDTLPTQGSAGRTDTRSNLADKTRQELAEYDDLDI